MYKSVKSYSLNLKLKKKKETGKKYRIPLNKNNKHKEEPMEAQSYQKTKDKMAIENPLSMTTLNVNGLNAPIKRQRVVH